MSQTDPQPYSEPVHNAAPPKVKPAGMATLAIAAFALLAIGFALWRSSQVPPASGGLAAAGDWRGKVASEMPLLGHRNWVLIVDSAYPLQTSQGVETVETNESQEEVVKTVLRTIDKSIQVRPVIYMDAELSQVPEADAPGVSAYRGEVGKLLNGAPVNPLPHEQLIGTVDEAGKTFHILILKTKMTIPYTSVFLRLDCKYWSADAEARLRSRLATQPAH